ncbi:MAG: hypothetical protein JO316_01355 [Abitibacteriaceae bacterium]|nr:hypothetical protein [Abditibacteriaceae bacterium]MBV9863977.1 hypothetical protein [Abditibacteriaceae bacterium]
MTRWIKSLVPLLCVVVLHSAMIVRAHAAINPRAKEDLDAFMKKFEEGDSLFNQKKYAEAAAALAAAQESYQRAERRDDSIRGFEFTLQPQTFPALRYYGYGMAPNHDLKENASGAIKDTASVLHCVANTMWRDASILSDAAKVPYGIDNEPQELTEEDFLQVVEFLYDPIKQAKLPVPDDEWRDVVQAGRRVQLILEHLLQKYPAWRTNKINWVGQPTGDEVLVDIKKKLAEAEPEYQKVVGDFKKAEPAGFADDMREEVGTLDKAIAGVKRNGWLDWILARDLYLDKDYLSKRRERFAHLYTAEGKNLPDGKLKPLEDKIAALQKAMDENASRWHFPVGQTHDAAIETRAKNAVKAKFPGATILNSALDGTDWTIQKNDLGLPRYRERDVLVLTKMPGQKGLWLIEGSYVQDYAGGGTYNAGGTFGQYSQVRIQTSP